MVLVSKIRKTCKVLNTIWLHSVRAYIRLGLFFYFKKIHVVNSGFLPKDKPVLLLANHQNALLDALLLASNNPRFSYYLTRASAFNSMIVSRILKSLRMLPVYRMRDGIQTISRNHDVFKICSKLLNNKQSIVIFPEGNHNLKRTVRPLSKGFTRLVFDALETNPDLELQLVPVGFNYQNATQFVDEVSIHFGNPINAQDFIGLDKNVATITLKEAVHQGISELTTHISGDHYEDTLSTLENLDVNFLNPKAVNRCHLNNFQNCDIRKRRSFPKLKSLLKVFLMINLWLPYIIWKQMIQPHIKEQEFVSTYRFTAAVTLVPIYLIIVTICIAMLMGEIFALTYFSAVILLALMVVKY